MPYPANPATGDEYVLSGKTWKYNGSRWSKLGFSETISAEVANSPGTLIYHSANTAPTGYIKANGAAVSRTTYADLFTAIGTTYGAGDGSSTFNVPDLRGEFMRGWDDSRGIDASRVFGSAQADELKSHTHTFNQPNANNRADGYSSSFTGLSSQSTGATGGNETRPRNIAFLACIKY
tara:strand:- start:6424 stop:6957 length:534 start_codon:yes stop_codon:yes gene_type:complete